jgi:hypothetical protein
MRNELEFIAHALISSQERFVMAEASGSVDEGERLELFLCRLTTLCAVVFFYLLRSWNQW